MELTTYSDDTSAQHFTYSFLGKLASVTDACGIRSISYDHYGNLSVESIQVGSLRYATQEHWDAYGRSTGGWTCAKRAPQRGEDSMGRVRITYMQIASYDVRQADQTAFTYVGTPKGDVKMYDHNGDDTYDKTDWK